MKKMIGVLILALSLNSHVQAQVDSNKNMDTSRMGSKQNKTDRNHNQDSTNSKKKMPPKMISHDSATAPQKMSPGMKGKSSSPKNR